MFLGGPVVAREGEGGGRRGTEKEMYTRRRTSAAAVASMNVLCCSTRLSVNHYASPHPPNMITQSRIG
jgi:hypothetical protein